jgi:hypothetical protein
MEPNAIPRPRTSVAAISSLVCGLLGCVPFLTGLAAVILGIVGIKKTRDPMVTGRGMAIAGLILGCLSLAGWALGMATLGGGVYLALKAADPARMTAEQFARDVSEGKIDAAVASSVEGMDRASLVALGEKMKPWGAFQSLGMNSINIQAVNGKAEYQIGGPATFATGPRTYTMTLHKEGETYKVAKFDFP